MPFPFRLRRCRDWLLALGSLVFVTCAPGQPVDGTLDPPPSTLVGVAVSPDSAAVQVGQTRAFQAEARFSDGRTEAAVVTWSATGGVITAAGVYTAGASPGSYRVIAVGDSGLADTAAVTVQAAPPPTLVSISLSPSSAAVLPGGTQQFSVSGTLSDGSSSVPAVTWTATGGTISNAGLYTAGITDGGFRVIARTSGGLADTAAVTIALPPATLVGVELSPDSVTLLSGQSRQFTAVGRLSDGSTTAVALTWSATGGSVTANGLYVAGVTAGSYRVIARSATGLADTSTVTITAPTITAITVTPASVTLASGQGQQFTAVATLSNGATQSNPSVTWTATGGTITANGLYAAGSAAGTYQVIASAATGPADTSAVTISATAPTITAITVTPATATLASAQTQQFTAVATLSDGSTQNNPGVTWVATGGTINTSGLYTAGSTAGSAFRVIASAASGPADTSAITITAPTIATITVTPATATLSSGQTQQFTAVATLSNGSTQNNPSVTWTATGGTVGGAGLYTAGSTTGSAFRVIAASANGKADTSAVTITAQAPTLTQLLLAPASTSLAAGASQQFTISGTWSDGSTTAPAVTYAATGGTVSPGGLYTAGATAGSYRVIASHVGGTLKDTSDVTITSSGGTVLFTEGFEDGSLGGRGWFDNTSVSVTTDARPGSSGTHALQWHWTNGGTTPQGASRRDFGPSNSVYLSYWVKHSSNWIGSGKNYHPHMFQIITTADDHFIGPSITHLALYDELLYLNGNLKAQLGVQDALMINEANIGVDLRGVTEQRSIGGYNGQHEFDDATSTVLWDLYLYSPGQHTNYRLIRPRAVTISDAGKNQWHHIESYWQLNSVVGGIGQQDGVQQYWVDGVLTIDRHDAYYRTGANPNMGFSTLLMVPYIGDGSPADQFMWIDDLTIGTARP